MCGELHALMNLGIACGATQETCGFVGLSPIWDLHYIMPGVMPPSLGTLTGAIVLSTLCMFDTAHKESGLPQSPCKATGPANSELGLGF